MCSRCGRMDVARPTRIGRIADSCTSVRVAASTLPSVPSVSTMRFACVNARARSRARWGLKTSTCSLIIALRPLSLLVRPHPVAYFWHVFEILPDVRFVFREQVLALSDKWRCQTSHACRLSHRLNTEMIEIGRASGRERVEDAEV